jgi:multidrug transporter EmrE-like cation transporter
MIESLLSSRLGKSPWTQIFIITATELLADFNLQRYSSSSANQPLFHLGAGVALYLVLALQIAFGLQTMGLAWLNGAWDASSTLASVAAGWFIGEKLEMKQWVGLSLIIAGTYLL